MNQSNYRNKRLYNKKGKAHGFNSKDTLFKKFIGLFGRKGKNTKVRTPNEVNAPIKRIFKSRKKYRFTCKPKSTNCAVKQYAQMKRDHGYLWNGSIELVVS